MVRYWRALVLNPPAQWNTHGGKRFEKFSKRQKELLSATLWALVKLDPTQNLESYHAAALECGFCCSLEYIRRIFAGWRWSWKKPSFQQLNKYTQENIEFYVSFLYNIRQKDQRSLKFMDEVHFMARDVSRQRALSPAGEPVVLLRSTPFHESYSVSCLTSLQTKKDVLYLLQ